MLARGSHRFGVEQVAREAGVTRRTVYHHFGSRVALLDGVVLDFEARAGIHDGLAVYAISDPVVRVKAIPQAACRIWASDFAVIKAVFQLALDPAVRELLDEHDAGRRRVLQAEAERLRLEGALRSGVTPEQATNVLWFLTSFEATDHLLSRAGLSPDSAGELLGALAATVVRGS